MGPSGAGLLSEIEAEEIKALSVGSAFMMSQLQVKGNKMKGWSV